MKKASLKFDRAQVAVVLLDEMTRRNQAVSHLRGALELLGDPVVVVRLRLQLLELGQLALDQLLLLPGLLLLLENLLLGSSSLDPDAKKRKANALLVYSIEKRER